MTILTTTVLAHDNNNNLHYLPVPLHFILQQDVVSLDPSKEMPLIQYIVFSQ